MEAPDVSADIPVLELVRPMVGFPDLSRFALARLVDDGLICDLRSLDDPQVSFVVVPPGEFFDGYTPEIDDDTVSALDVETADDLLVLALVTLGETAESATANLRAPLLVNHRNRRAAQAILDDPELPMKAPLTPQGDSTRADRSH
jgi:flagellar assembly factor FliW